LAHSVDDVEQQPVAASERAMHVNCGSTVSDALTATSCAAQPRMLRHGSPVEQVMGAESSDAQHDEPPDEAKNVDLQRCESTSHVLTEHSEPSSQSEPLVHWQFLSMPDVHRPKPGLNGSGKQSARMQAADVGAVQFDDAASQQPPKRVCALHELAMHVS
jgi:hypothetical protein